MTRTMREPENGEREHHSCSPIGEPVYPQDAVGGDLDRYIARPCIGIEPMARQCDTPHVESAVRLLSVEAAADTVLWLESQLQRPTWRTPRYAERRKLLGALLEDLRGHPKVSGLLNDWERESEDRRRARLVRAQQHRHAEEGPMELIDPARPLPEPEGHLG